MTVTQPPAEERDAAEPVIEPNASATAPAERIHFPEIEGLRGLAVACIVAYQTFRNAGAPWHAPFFERLVIDAGQGLVLFLTISGFVLAYPLLAALRANPPAFVDMGRFAVGRALRIYPAYLVTLCLATTLHPLAVLFNYPALARATPQIGVGTFVRGAVFAGNGLGNDGLRAAGLFVLAAIAFPLLLALATSRPRAVAILAIAAGLADAFTGAHAVSIGFVVPLTLGILAAELRLRDHRLQRFWPAVVLAGVALALLFEKHVALLPGATAAPDALRVDPFWSLAAFGILIGTGGSTVLRRVAGFVVLRRLGAASYAISLVAMPIAGFAVHQLPPRIGYPAVVLVAACAALAAGFALWRGIDRAFANGIARRASALRPGALLDRALARFARRSHRRRVARAEGRSSRTGAGPERTRRSGARPRPGPARGSLHALRIAGRTRGGNLRDEAAPHRTGRRTGRRRARASCGSGRRRSPGSRYAGLLSPRDPAPKRCATDRRCTPSDARVLGTAARCGASARRGAAARRRAHARRRARAATRIRNGDRNRIRRRRTGANSSSAGAYTRSDARAGSDARGRAGVRAARRSTTPLD